MVLDLDGDGIEITPLTSSNIFLDTAGDGKQHRTAWAAAGDGVLVRDAGNDGVISTSNEFDFKQWDSTATSDMQALLNVFDTNHDGKLNTGDADWALFKVLVTNPDGTTTLRTMAELGITSIDLVSNQQEVALSDGSTISGTTTFTKSDGTTGTAGDVSLAYDPTGYIVAQTVAVDVAGVTTIVNTATNPDGSVANITTSATSADGLNRTIFFDDDGDGVAERRQTEVKLIHGDGSVTVTLQDYDGSGTILIRSQVTLTSADGKTVTVSLDQDGSGVFDRVETRVTAADGSLTVSVSHLNTDGSLHDRQVQVTSADGLSQTKQVQLTGSGANNASQVETTAVASDGTRTETITAYAGSDTTIANRIRSTVTVTDVTGANKAISNDLDGDGDTDLGTTSAIVRNANGSTTTTISHSNGDGSLRDQTINDLSADGLSKTTQSDLDGDGDYDLTITDVTVVGASSTTETITGAYLNGDRQSQSVATWSQDGKTRTTSVDSDGDGAFDKVETVAVVAGNSVDTISVYSPDGTTLVSRAVTTTSANGLTQTTQIDANGDAVIDAVSTIAKVLNADHSSTVTVTDKNGDGTIDIGKTVTVTTADGLSTTTNRYIGTVLQTRTTDVMVKNANGSMTETVTNFAGSSLAQTGRSITDTSADRQTTTTKDYVGGNALPETITTKVINADGSKVQTVWHYSPDGVTPLDKSVASISADGLMTTTTSDVDGHGVTDATQVAATVLNAGGTTTTTTTHYAGSATLASNKVGQTIVTTSGNGLTIASQTDADGNGVADSRTSDVTVLNADGSRTRTLLSLDGTGTVQTGKTVSAVSDDGQSKTVATYVGNHTTADQTVTDVTVLNADGSSVETVTTKSANATLVSQSVTTTSGDGLSVGVATDRDGNGVNDSLVTAVTAANGAVSTEASTYTATGVLASRSTTATSATGLSSTTTTDLDGNGTTDRSSTDVIVLNANGSKTETLSHFKAGGVLQDKTIVTISADGLSTTTQWDGTGAGSLTGSQTDVTTINSNGSTTQVISNLNANGSLHDRSTIDVSSDHLVLKTTRDLNGDGVVDQTVLQTRNPNGTVTTSSMDGVVQSAAGRLYGSVHGRYETISADGLVKTTQYDANGNGLAESQSVDTIVRNADGRTVETIVNSTLSGGSATSADPIYTATLTEKAVITTAANGLSTTTEWDLNGDATLDETQTAVTVLNADGSAERTISQFVGATLQTRTLVTTSADGMTVTTQRDANGSGVYSEISTDTVAKNADGSTSKTETNTTGGGTFISTFVITTSADGRTVETRDYLDNATSLSQRHVTTVASLADGTSIVTTSDFNANGSLRDRTVTTTSGDGATVSTTRDSDGNGSIDRTELLTHRIDGQTESVVTDFGSGGVKSGQLISTTSTDSLLTTSQRDLDGDGIIDKTTTRNHVNNADGSSSDTLKIYQVSEKAINGSVTITMPTLQQTVATITTADGKSQTTSVDVDGNGAFDEISTTTTKIDGSSVTHTTDNLAARASAGLSGDVQWASAIVTANRTTAADAIVTVSADGFSRAVQADYDGNGTKEHIEAWTTLIDGKQVGTITDVNSAGVVIARGTETISADGLTTTLLVDSTNDGIIDYREISVTHIDGTKTKTLATLDASGTVLQTAEILVNANGQAIYRGGDGNDSFVGTSQGDKLYGDAGNDILNGGDGDDLLEGGTGSDTMGGGDGFDTASYANALTGVFVNLADRTLNTGDALGDTYTSIEAIVGSAYNDILVGYTQSMTFAGGSGNDTITGSSAADTLYGGDGSDILSAGGGGDYLEGGTGADYLDGSSGRDTASYLHALASVSVNLANSALNTGDALGDTYTSIEVIVGSAYNDILVGYTQSMTFAGGSGNDTITGSSAADTLYGDDGSDILSAGGGDDYLEGGAGADYLDGSSGRDTASYANAGAGLIVNLSNLSLNTGDALGDTYTSIEVIVGSAYNDILVGYTQSMTFAGGSGNDTITGSSASDTLYGDAGNDSLIGGDGDDYLEGGIGADALAGGNGVDTVSYANAASGVTLNITTMSLNTGEALGDTMSSIERFVGSAFGDNFALTSNLASTVFAGAGNDIVTGSSYADTLYGDAGNDTLSGGEGNDYLDGGAGADVMVGGNGNDTYVIDNAGDVVTETGTGVDTIVSIFSTTLAFNMENLTITGSSVVAMNGNYLNNVLISGAGKASIYGGDGDDTIIFGSGGGTAGGGNGHDYFALYSISMTNIILDWHYSPSDYDIVDLSNIDANVNIAGNQAFTITSGGHAYGGIGPGAVGTLNIGYHKESGDTNGNYMAVINNGSGAYQSFDLGWGSMTSVPLNQLFIL